MPFEPGKSGNPNGRPPMPKDVKEARQLTQRELEISLQKYLLMTPEQLKKAKQDPETTMIDHLIISVMTHGVNKGDQNRVDFLMNRLVGKIKQQVEMSGQLDIRPYKEIADEDLERRIKELEGREALPIGTSKL